MCYTINAFGATENRFAVIKSRDLRNWEHVTYVDMSAAAFGVKRVWAPEWFVDPDTDQVYVCAAVATTNVRHRLYCVSPTNALMTEWKTPIQLTGPAFPEPSGSEYVTYIDGHIIKKDGIYYITFKNGNSNYIEMASAPAITGSWMPCKTGDWAGIGGGQEGNFLIEINSGVWRLYFAKAGTGVFGVRFVESTDGWATWSQPSDYLTDQTGAKFNHCSFLLLTRATADFLTAAVQSGKEEIIALQESVDRLAAGIGLKLPIRNSSTSAVLTSDSSSWFILRSY